MPSITPPPASFDAMLAAIDQAAHESAFGFGKQRPTDATCNAGNYKVGRVQWQGLSLCIEQPYGSVREKSSKTTGRKWRNTMGAHYGYLAGTKGADGDAVDCFIGAQVDSSTVYVINQGFEGRFDEHKVMLCFGSAEAARAAYLASYELGWTGLQSMVPMALDQFRWWLKYANLDQPADSQNLPYNHKETQAMKPTAWTGEALPIGGNLDQLIYDIRRDDGTDGLLLDSASILDILSDPENESVLALDALVTPFAKLEQRMGLLRAAMDRVSSVAVKTQAMQVSDPFKQRGTAQVAVVYELSDGQTISVYLHNPDADPGKISPDDELISWKWMLNKKDVTIVVAPELGKDLNVREVARRMMRLADKNSAAFQRANGKRSERLQAIESLKGVVGVLEGELIAAQKDLELAKLELDEHQMAQIEAAKNKPKNLEMTRSEWEAKVMTALKNRVKSDPYEWIGGGEMDDRNLKGVLDAQWLAQAAPEEAAKVLQEAGQQWDADKAKAMDEAQKAEAEAEAARKAQEQTHYSDKILQELVSSYGWSFTREAGRPNAVTKGFAGVAADGEQSGGSRVFFAAFDGDARRYLTLKLGFDDLFDMDCRDVEPGHAAAQFNDRVNARIEQMRAEVAKPAKVKAVTKKEAREAYDALSTAMRFSYGSNMRELANTNDANMLAKVEACEALIARGLPDFGGNMPNLVKTARNTLDRIKVAKARAAGDFGPVGALIEAVAKELQELGWTVTQDGKPSASADDETEGGQWAVESPQGTEVVMGLDDRVFDEIDFNGSFDYIARAGDDPAAVAQGIDQKDWAENSGDAPGSDDGIVDDDESEFFGKSLEFVRANIDLEKAAAAAGAELLWGDFTASLHTGSLFDGATHFGVSAQIGKDGQVAARASISEGGFVTLYAGAAGDAVALESASAKIITAKVAELVATLPAQQAEPEPQPEPQPLPEPEKTPDTPVARINALLKAKPKGEIRSDDPDAIAKLQAKLAYLEGYGEIMRATNKLVRKDDRAGLAAMGWSEKTIEGLFKKDFAGRIGFPDYEMKNTNAEARRTKQRLESLKPAEPMPETEKTTASTEYRYALVYRPAGMGASPSEGFLRVDPAPAEIASVARHGVAVYSRELTEQELKQFELRRVHTEAERAAAVEAIAQHFAGHKYADNYYEYVKEGDMAMLEETMRQELWKQYPFDAFANSEAIPKEAGARFSELMQAKQGANAGRATVDGYTYDLDTTDGYMVTFTAPETVRGLKLWAREEDVINAKIQDAIDLAKTSPHLAKRWNSKRGEVTHVALSNMPTMGEGSESYDVVYSNGEVRRVSGKDFDETMQREAYEATPEGVAAIAAERTKREADAAEAQARREAAEKAAADRKQAVDSIIDEWLSKTQYTPVQKGSARAILSREAIYPEFERAQLARAEFVQRVVDKGGKTDVRQVNRIKEKTRVQFNRMDNREQQEHERKVRDGGTAPEYSLGQYTVTKTEYDYANFLMGKKSPAQEQAATTADPERAKAVQTLQGIADGATDALTVDFDDLEAIYNRYQADAEIAALFEKAAEVVANAALAATA